MSPRTVRAASAETAIEGRRPHDLQAHTISQASGRTIVGVAGPAKNGPSAHKATAGPQIFHLHAIFGRAHKT